LRHLEDKGLSWGQATKSTVYLRIGSKTIPTSTVNIPLLFTASTSDERPISFTTVEAGHIDPSTIPDDKGYYTIELKAECTEYGSIGDVVQETINNIVTTMKGIDIVYNTTASSGGIDKESIASVRSRLKTITTTFDRGTIGWFTTEARKFSFVKDVYVIPSYNGNGCVLLSLAGYGSLTPEQIQEVQDHFDNESINDAGAYYVIANEVESVTINIDITVKRLTESLTQEMVENEITSFFESIKVGKDFVRAYLIGYLFSNLNGVYDIDLTTPSANIVIAQNQTASLGSLTVTMVDVEEE